MKQLESWIHNYLHVEQGTYQDLTENMERQCPVDIAGPYRDWNPTIVSDWEDRVVFSYLLDLLPPQPTVLDVGFGDGWPSLLIAPYVGEVVGIDIAAQRVRKATENQLRRGITNARFLQMSGEEMGFADATFDGVFSYSCIEQTDSFATLKEIYRVLKPNGVLIGHLQDLTRFSSGEFIERYAPTAKSKSTHGDYLVCYTIADIPALTEVNYIIPINEVIDTEIQKLVRDSSLLHAELATRVQEIFAAHQAEIGTVLTYTTNHLSIPMVVGYLQDAGFREITVFHFANLPKILKIIAHWKETGLLGEMGVFFDQLTQDFKQLLEVAEGQDPTDYHIMLKAVK